jgi:hypothetical protein
VLRWIRAWHRRRKGLLTPGQLAARAALYRVECDRQAVEERAPAVSEVARTLREMRHANHFAERIQLLLEGGRG